jgi:hypothetical protein
MFEHMHIVAVSSNSKTGPIPVTYRDMDATCPRDCPFFANGCYGDGRIKALARKFSSTVTLDHANSVLSRRLKSARYLRDRVVGDLVDASGKFDMGYVLAIAKLSAKHGLKVFGYTHAWRKLTKAQVKRKSASGYVMNASCETVADVRQAISLGMPVVITNDNVPERDNVAGYRVITCPAQVRDNVTCASCGLCAKPDRKVIIRFLTHGPSKKRARKAIAEQEAH